MTPSAPTCPYGPLCERDLAGPDLDEGELARLERHLSEGCAECEKLIESHISGEGATPDAEERRDLDRVVGRAVDDAAERMAPSRAAVLARVEDELRRERQAQLLRLRRRNLRAIFYVTNLAALVLLLVAYVGTVLVVRVRLREAQRQQTETELQAMRAALTRYVKERGVLPEDARTLVVELSRPARHAPDEEGAPFYRFEPTRVQGGEYLDAFGRPYRFVAGRDRALLYSVGVDGRDAQGEGDDVAAWVHFVQDR